MSLIDRLVRPEVAALEAYAPIVPLDVLAERLGLPIEALVKLDANENPYGPSPRALAALAGEPYYAIYPDPEQGRLRAAISAQIGVPASQIIAGAGADELIDLVLRAIITPGAAIIDCPPTFAMYAFDAKICGGRVISVPRRADFGLDLAAIEAAAAQPEVRALFLTTPNNPTGNLTPLSEIERLLKLPLLVVVDEAYIEFAELGGAQSVARWVAQYENLVVLRTFSKWAGLAGLRVGYAVLPEAFASHIWKIKQPYNVSVAAQQAAIASLDDYAERYETIIKIVAERERLFAALQQLGELTPFPSAANFILCRIEQADAGELKAALAQRGILVRHYRTPLLSNFLRFSIGTPEQNERLLAALSALLQPAEVNR